MALDRTLRRLGGAPTHCLTDNEKTVSVDHVCGIAVRNPKIDAVARHYGLTIATCVPADPQNKGGSEAGGTDREGRPGGDASRSRRHGDLCSGGLPVDIAFIDDASPAP